MQAGENRHENMCPSLPCAQAAVHRGCLCLCLTQLMAGAAGNKITMILTVALPQGDTLPIPPSAVLLKLHCAVMVSHMMFLKKLLGVLTPENLMRTSFHTGTGSACYLAEIMPVWPLSSDAGASEEALHRLTRAEAWLTSAPKYRGLWRACQASSPRVGWSY